MFSSIARTSLLVHDYDEALAFYRDAFGFEVLFDAEPDGRGRFLHVGLPAQPGVGLWFRRAGAEDRHLVGRQSGREPFLVLYTEDRRAAAARLKARGVRFRVEPREDTGAVVAHVGDLYGNEIVVAELRA